MAKNILLISIAFLMSPLFADEIQVVFTERPRQLQFFARDVFDSSFIDIRGSVLSAGNDSAISRLYRNNVLIRRSAQYLVYNGDRARFDMGVRILSELAEYRIEFLIDDNVIFIADSLLCGDAFLAEGQSNTEAAADPPYTYKSEWIRTYGGYSPDAASCLADTDWNVANARVVPYGLPATFPGFIGIWELQIARNIVETYQTPVFFLNGALGGTAIAAHLPAANRADPNAIYGRFYFRTDKSGLRNGVKALYWYQGESNSGDYSYADTWSALRTAWKADFPNLSLFYVIQIDHQDCGGARDVVQEQQRTLASRFSDVRLMSTNGLPGGLGCHYDLSGYILLGDHLFDLTARDYYGSTDILGITPPNIRSAFYKNIGHRQLALLFDQPVTWSSPALKNRILLDAGFIDSGTVSQDTLFLHSTTAMTARRVSYYPGPNEPFIRNSRGIGALSFKDFPIADSEAGTEQCGSTGFAASAFDLSASPNPFNPESRISFYLAERGKVRLSIYDLSGRCVKTLADGNMKAGSHHVNWDGSGLEGNRVSAGLYICKLLTGDAVKVKKMIYCR